MDMQNTGLPLGEYEQCVAIAKQFRIGAPEGITSYGTGIINDTYLVEIPRGNPHRRSILQKLHPVFKASVMEDIEAITSALVNRGVRTPYLIQTKAGSLYVQESNRYWRMLSYVPGVSYERPPDEPVVESAARFLARFHRETASLEWKFKHRIPDFHNTPRIMRKLYEVFHRFKGTMRYDALAPSAERVLDAYAYLDPTIPLLPKRLLHGDPKFSNVRFDDNGTEAIALLDLDTLGRGSIIIDLGDAIRSWCDTPQGTEKSSFNLSYFEAFLRGYFREVSFLNREEKASVLEGAELLMLELTARFLADAFEESYFKFDPEKYESLFEQNHVQASRQLTLYEDLQHKRPEARALLEQYAA